MVVSALKYTEGTESLDTLSCVASLSGAIMVLVEFETYWVECIFSTAMERVDIGVVTDMVTSAVEAFIASCHPPPAGRQQLDQDQHRHPVLDSISNCMNAESVSEIAEQLVLLIKHTNVSDSALAEAIVAALVESCGVNNVMYAVKLAKTEATSLL